MIIAILCALLYMFIGMLIFKIALKVSDEATAVPFGIYWPLIPGFLFIIVAMKAASWIIEKVSGGRL